MAKSDIAQKFFIGTDIAKEVSIFAQMLEKPFGNSKRKPLSSSLTSGIGTHVKKTVTSKKNFLPQMSERAPTSGAARNDRMPLIPTIRPFIRNVFSGKVEFNTLKKI